MLSNTTMATPPSLQQGKLIIISGPSGVGKTSICKALCERNSNIRWSVSATTRPRRENEVEGRDYYFMDEKTFMEKVKNNEFLEYTEVHGAYYGTLRDHVLAALNDKCCCLMDIDVQGAKKILQQSFPTVTIFIAISDLEILQERLKKRGTPSAIMERRIYNAQKEMAEAHHYDYYVENLELEQTIQSVQEIVDKALQPAR